VLNGSRATNYITKEDPNYLSPYSIRSTLIFGRFYAVCAWLIISFLFLSLFVTLKTTVLPAYLTIMFTQTIYYTLTANINYPRWFYEYLKFFSFSSFEYHLFPHILSEQIFNTDKYKNDIYAFRFKRAGMYHNSGAINTECKI